MAAKKSKLPVKTFTEIKSAWDALQELDPREKFKSLKQIGFDVYSSYQKNKAVISNEARELYIEIIKTAIKYLPSTGRFSALLSKMIADKLIISGNAQAVILSKLSDKLNIESGVIIIGDSNFEVSNTFIDSSEKALLPIMNEGKCFIFGTGGDGEFNVQIRVIEASEPVLTIKEYKFARETSQVTSIAIPSGEIAVADFPSIHDSSCRLIQKLTPGIYKVAVFRFEIPDKLDSYYIVLCRTEQAIDNNLTKIDVLG